VSSLEKQEKKKRRKGQGEIYLFTLFSFFPNVTVRNNFKNHARTKKQGLNFMSALPTTMAVRVLGSQRLWLRSGAM
jgi:hypothetical protein